MITQFDPLVAAQYDPVGASSQFGYRAGNYISPRSTSNVVGLPVGSPLAYVTPVAEAANLFSTSQGVTADGFLNLENANQGGVTVESDKLVLDCARDITITSSSSAFTVNVSMYDMHGRQMTCFGNSEVVETVHTFSCIRIPAAIVSIQFYGVDTTTFQCNVSTGYIIGLPYNTYNLDSMIRTVNYGNYILLEPVINESTPYYSQYYAIEQTTPAANQTGNEGVSLPSIDLTVPLTSINDFTELLVIEQFLPIGMPLETPPFNQPTGDSVGTVQENLIGEKPYNINFRGWNGYTI